MSGYRQRDDTNTERRCDYARVRKHVTPAPLALLGPLARTERWGKQTDLNTVEHGHDIADER